MLENKTWQLGNKPSETGFYAIVYMKLAFMDEEQAGISLDGFGFFMTAEDHHEVGFTEFPIAVEKLDSVAGWMDVFDDVGDPIRAEQILAFIGPIVLPEIPSNAVLLQSIAST